MILKLIAAALSLVAVSPLFATAPPTALIELVAAEKQALEQAKGKPPAEAIVSMIEADTRVYTRGGPYVGKAAALTGIKSNPGNLGTGTDWLPVKSGMSSDGKHGFTLGYFDISGGTDPKVAHHRYLAYWVRGADGWKIAAIKQSLRRPEEKVLDSLPPSFPAQATTTPPDSAAARQSLIDAEQAFSDDQSGRHQDAETLGKGRVGRSLGPFVVKLAEQRTDRDQQRQRHRTSLTPTRPHPPDGPEKRAGLRMVPAPGVP